MGKNIAMLISLFTKHERKLLYGLLLLMVMLAGMELLGLGSVFSYISLLTNQDTVFSNKYLSFIFTKMGFNETRPFIFFLGCGVFIIMVVRGVLSLLNLYFQARFASTMRNRLSMQLLESYIAMPYKDFLSTNTAILSKHLIEEIGNVVACISMFLLLLTEIIVAVALIGLMFVVDPLLVGFIVVVLGGITLGIITLTKGRISRIGRENEQCSRMIYKSASEALGGLKEIKVFNAEVFFKDKFRGPLYRSSDLTIHYKVLGGFPGMILNLMALGTLLLILLYLLRVRGNIVGALPLIGLLGLSMQRLLPSADKIYNAIGLIRKYEPGISIIHGLLGQIKDKDIQRTGLPQDDIYSPIVFANAITAENVTFTYPQARRKALDSVNLTIPKCSCIGIIGSSGAGKSTLVDVLLGLLPVSEGRILCDNTTLDSRSHREFQRLIGYVPQQTFLLDESIRANIAFGVPSDKIEEGRLVKTVRIAQLEEFIKHLPQGFDTRIGERGIMISGGQRQRIGIARALYHDPEILILDEATNSLDLSTEADFLESLKVLTGKKTLIVIAHRLSSLILCERLVLLKDGKVAASGTLEELKASSLEFNELYEMFT